MSIPISDSQRSQTSTPSPILPDDEYLILARTLDMKVCSKCTATSTPAWYKTPSNQDQCKNCYTAARKALAMSGVSGRTCLDCNATSTFKWYKTLLKQDRCSKCYTAAKKALAISGVSGRTCSDCNAISTSQWYKTPLNQDRCSKCYQVAKRALTNSEGAPKAKKRKIG